MEIIFEAQNGYERVSMCSGCQVVDDNGTCHQTDQ